MTTLFEIPLSIPAEGPGDDGAAWWLYSAQFGGFMHIEPDLSAKYQSQGALVILADDADSLECFPGKPLADYAEAEHDRPPFSPSEIAWWAAAAEYGPDAYGRVWRRIKWWLRKTKQDPDAIVTRYRQELGRWGGFTDLERLDSERVSQSMPDTPAPHF